MTRLALVTGGTGYLGSALTSRLLAEGSTPVLLVRSVPRDRVPGVEYVQIEAAESDANPWRDAEFDAAFHLAAAPFSAPLDDQLLATLGIGSLVHRLVAGQERPATVVFAGSYWQDAIGPHGAGPLNEYAAVKAAFSSLAAFRAAHDGVPHVLLHIGDVFGPDDPRPKFLPEVLDAIRHGSRVAATSGEQIVSFVHRDDVVTALVLAASMAIEERPQMVEHAVMGARIEPLRDAFLDLDGVVPGGLPIDWGVRQQRGRSVERVNVPLSLPGWRPEHGLSDFVRQEVASWETKRVD